jgi:hypothetical protein
MAVHSWQASEREANAFADDVRGLLGLSARNLNHYFPNLPDSQIVYALVNPDQIGSLREQVLSELVASGAMPVLAGHVRLMARFAAETGQSEAPVTRLAGLLARDQPWSLTLHPDGMSGLVAQRELAVTAGV